MSIFDSLDNEQKDVEINNLINSLNKEFGTTAIKRGIKEESKNVNLGKFDKSWK